jgi:hypothetical protein
MVGKQFSVSVINLATSISSNRINQQTSVVNDPTQLNLLDQRKHAVSEENLPTTVRIPKDEFVLFEQTEKKMTRGFSIDVITTIESSQYVRDCLTLRLIDDFAFLGWNLHLFCQC